MNKNRKLIADLNDFIDFLEAHPDIEVDGNISISNPASSRENIAQIASQIGSAAKTFDDNYFRLYKYFGKIRVYWFVTREEICERVVVGKKIVPAVRLPACEERVIPEREVEIVEWRCPESLLKTAEQLGSQVPPSAPVAALDDGMPF